MNEKQPLHPASADLLRRLQPAVAGFGLTDAAVRCFLGAAGENLTPYRELVVMAHRLRSAGQEGLANALIAVVELGVAPLVVHFAAAGNEAGVAAATELRRHVVAATAPSKSVRPGKLIGVSLRSRSN